MQLKLNIIIGLAALALFPNLALAQTDGGCYDAEQHPVKFSDLGSKSDITQALSETCETPVGDHMYECNAAVSAQTTRRREQRDIRLIQYNLRL